MPGIGTGIRGRAARRKTRTKKNNSQIASVFRSASFVKATSKRRKGFSAERGAKRLGEINPRATIRTTRISLGNCSIVLPLAEFISRNILGYQTWMGRQVRYRITDFIGQAAIFVAWIGKSISGGRIARPSRLGALPLKSSLLSITVAGVCRRGPRLSPFRFAARRENVPLLAGIHP